MGGLHGYMQVQHLVLVVPAVSCRLRTNLRGAHDLLKYTPVPAQSRPKGRCLKNLPLARPELHSVNGLSKRKNASARALFF